VQVTACRIVSEMANNVSSKMLNHRTLVTVAGSEDSLVVCFYYCRHQHELEAMQMKQQQELQRYIQQVQQNIETVSASELLQAIMAQTYQLDPVVSHMSTGGGTAWSSFASPSATGVIYSTAGLHQPPLPATYVPPQQTMAVDVITTSDTMANEQVLPSTSVDSQVDSMHNESGADDAARAVGQPAAVDAFTAVTDGWQGPASSVMNTDTSAVVLDNSLDLTTETAQTDRNGSPSIVSLQRASSLRDQASRPMASSDCEVSISDQSINMVLRRKQSAETAAFLLDPTLHAATLRPLISADPPAVDNVALPPSNLPEIPSLDFVPIQNQLISSRSDSMDSMASSLTGSAVQQSVEGFDLMHQSVKETTVAESAAKSVLSCQPSVCNTSVQPPTVSTQRPVELLDTLQLLLGYLGNSADVASTSAGHSSLSTGEPTQQLQQSQAIIQQQQQQQLSAIASAIQNLQHLRSLQEAIGSLAVALKTSQLQMLTGEVMQAGEVSTTSVGASLPAGSVVPVAVTTVHAAAVRQPMSSVQGSATHGVLSQPTPAPTSSAVPGLIPDPRSLAPAPPAPSQLSAAQLSALGLPQPAAAAATSNAPLLMGAPQPLQQQQHQLLLAMMHSAPYQQQQQQLLMQQLLSQNAAAVMRAAAAAGGGRGVPQQQQAWPMMMTPAPRRATPQPSSLPGMISAQPVPSQPSGLPGMSAQPVMMSASAQPVASHTSGLPGMVSAHAHAPQPSGLPVMSTQPAMMSANAQVVAPQQSGLPVMMPASAQPVPTQPSGLPGMVSVQPVATHASGVPVIISAQPVAPTPAAARLSVQVPVSGPRQPHMATTTTLASTTLPIPPQVQPETGTRSGAQTPAMTSSVMTATVVTASVPPPSLQTNLPDQR